MNILRYLQVDCVRLELQTTARPAVEDETEAQRDKRLAGDKEAVIQELTDLLDISGQIVNPTKFYKDMINRERRATTAIAPGIAVPHVRSDQVRSFTMGFARSTVGVPFASLDGGLRAADERLYLRVYREFAEMIRHQWVVDSFMDAESPQDVLNVLRGYVVS
ncbi:MAG: PTS sugar transporter subunit IIA [Planctomycetota bacterium]